MGFEENLVKRMESIYMNTRAKISLGGVCLEWVYSRRGARQGCPLSALLFSLYTEEFTVRIRGTGLGIKVWEGKGNTLGCLLYVDDIVLLAEDNDTIMRLLEVTGKYGNGREFRVNFGDEKSQVMVIKGHEEEERDKWMLEIWR